MVRFLPTDSSICVLIFVIFVLFCFVPLGLSAHMERQGEMGLPGLQGPDGAPGKGIPGERVHHHSLCRVGRVW